MTAHDSETERRILDAADAVFLRRGTAGARMQEIADEAGVDKALLHYYFRSKDRLAAAVFQRAARELFPFAVVTIASNLPLEEKVERFIHLYLDTIRRNPHLPGYILSELHHHPERAGQLLETLVGRPAEGLAPPVLETLGAQIEERVRAGRMHPIAPEQFVLNLISLCIFPFAAKPLIQVLLGLDEGDFDRLIDERRTDLPGFFLRALRP